MNVLHNIRYTRYMPTIHGKNFIWTHLNKPSEEDILEIAKNRDLHFLVADELLHPTFRPKVEQYGSHLYLILHFPKYDAQDSNRGNEIDFVIGKDFLITTQYAPLPALEEFVTSCETDKRKAMQYLTNTGELLYHLLSRLFAYSLTELEKMDKKISAMENSIFREQNRKYVEDISLLRREILDFRRIIHPQQSVLRSLEEEGKVFFGKDMCLYLSRIIGDYLRMWHILENHKETVEALHETNESLLSIRTAEITKNLTIMAFIALPLTLLANLFGMNVSSFPIVGNPYDFWIIVGIMFVGILGMFVFFKWKKWI
ncbi:MAG: magnesium transporter [Parcubacteria group bacterium Gr01-1014_29]|nr:MAG: magnesium transporter [Parcubacteria group bacterium Gr01-1014_29]